MRDFVVHSIPGSPYGRAVLMVMEEKGFPYRFAPVTPGAHRQAPHLGKHPFGRIPVLDHGDFTLYETQAILRYVDRILPEPPLTPAEPKAAGRMDQLMNINDWYFFQGVGNTIGFERVVKPALRGMAPDEAVIDAAMPEAVTVFNEIARLLGENPYLAGQTLSLADIMLAPQIDFFVGIPEWEILTGQHDNLRRWIARMSERPSMQATTWPRVSAMAQAA
jgi:glutathione S-transferase